MKTTSFLRGMGVGVAAGAAVGAIAAMKRDSMRTGVGRAMRRRAPRSTTLCTSSGI